MHAKQNYKDGYLTLGDLTKAIKYENNKRNKKKISMILGTFP